MYTPLSTLARFYLYGTQGIFVERVNRLTRADGDLAVVVRQQVKEAEQTLDEWEAEHRAKVDALSASVEPKRPRVDSRSSS